MICLQSVAHAKSISFSHVFHDTVAALIIASAAIVKDKIFSFYGLFDLSIMRLPFPTQLFIL